jgi:hypothetical protein
LRGRDLTPAAVQLTALAGVLTSFGEARARALPKMAGPRLAESAVQRITEAAGRRLKEGRARGRTHGPATAWDWHEDATGRRCAYLSLDAAGVGQQGPGGQAAGGRTAYAGMIFDPRPAAGPGAAQARYLPGLYDLDELGAQLRRQGAQVGMGRADRWVAVTGGGAGLEEFVRAYFPRAEVIPDFYHAAEHLNDLAKAWYKDEAEAQGQATSWCHTLKHQGGQAVPDVLEGLDLRGRPAAAPEVHRQVTQYVRNNAHRADYPRYQANGWSIGSGHVEAACKAVVGARLKGSGMRRGEAGADSVCDPRALFKSEASQWDAFWSPSPN